MNQATLKFLSFGLLALVPACASSDPSRVSLQDPYADPSKFESLASNAYQMPAVSVAVAVPAATTILTGESLASGAVPFVPEVALAGDRSIASVKPDTEVTTSEGAYSTLIRGNERFVNGTVKGEHRDSARRRDLASSQKPFAIVLSCSDSRVPPELIFDQGLGDLFTIRVAGNVLGSAQVASIEYAVEHLGTKLIVVMGHESCGAVKASLLPTGVTASKTHASAGSPDLDWLVSSIRPALKSRGLASVQPDDPKIRKPVMANIDSVTENLLVRSKIIDHAMANGNLKVVRGIYSLDSGQVDFWGMK